MEATADAPGFCYIYLSNDAAEGKEAFFDDFTVEVEESPLIQMTDYYPYGLVAENWVREIEDPTKELFQGKTLDSKTGWYDFHARQYDPALGRWFAVDPKSTEMPSVSPYGGMGNNPVAFTDPSGENPVLIGALIGLGTNGINNLINGDSFFQGGGKAALFWSHWRSIQCGHR
ncbi:RHS repeat-associated core domain-containing protein [Echinicola soli]|uniref:RHS repeat-associated core domain-containing protein n=2 Tax=Echinicola soli TaxID=2591634 RepID=A0A514CP72_9BACT|nr:RHS repeat-associated core domain-containing protein [Echinicola soli]